MRASLVGLLVAGGMLVHGSGRADWNPEPSAGGLAVNTGLGDQTYPAMVSNGYGGAFMSWVDEGAGGEVVVQQIHRNGYSIWTAGGVVVTTGPVLSGVRSTWRPMSNSAKAKPATNIALRLRIAPLVFFGCEDLPARLRNPRSSLALSCKCSSGSPRMPERLGKARLNAGSFHHQM